MDRATEEHRKEIGYVKDPRVPEQPGNDFTKSGDTLIIPCSAIIP